MATDEDDPVARTADAGLSQLAYSQDLHRRLGIWPSSGIGFDQQRGVLSFLDLDGTEVVAPIQVIGTLDTSDESWLWAWANPSIFEPLKQAALQVRAFGEKHGNAELTTASIPCSYEKAWRFVGLAFELADTFDAYSVPQDHGWIFFLLKGVPKPRTS